MKRPGISKALTSLLFGVLFYLSGQCLTLRLCAQGGDYHGRGVWTGRMRSRLPLQCLTTATTVYSAPVVLVLVLGNQGSQPHSSGVGSRGVNPFLRR
jgi:hypothetical protein